MGTSLKINLSFDQILSIVKQLPKKDKLQLSKALEREFIDSKLTDLLKTFNTDELDLKTIDKEVEHVRQEIYGKQKP